MNKTRRQVPAEFAPETRFELRAAPAVPFRATRECEFERLKTRLLAQQLERADEVRFTAPLRRAANEAAAVAWATGFPLLMFPVLFEEKTGVALGRAKRQAAIYANSRELLAA